MTYSSQQNTGISFCHFIVCYVQFHSCYIQGGYLIHVKITKKDKHTCSTATGWLWPLNRGGRLIQVTHIAFLWVRNWDFENCYLIEGGHLTHGCHTQVQLYLKLSTVVYNFNLSEKFEITCVVHIFRLQDLAVNKESVDKECQGLQQTIVELDATCQVKSICYSLMQ